MMRKTAFLIFVLAFCATAAWPKFKEDDQKYLDDQFHMVLEQVQQMSTQIQTLNAQLTELRQNQAQFQAVIIRQQRALQDLEQLVSSLRLGSEDNFSNVKLAISQLRTETQNAFKQLSGQAVPQPAGSSEQTTAQKPAAAPASEPPKHYITDVQGDNVMVDLGSSAGLHPGSKLGVYKAADPSTRVGLLEVTQVVDADNARAKVITMTTGVRPQFADLVRVE